MAAPAVTPDQVQAALGTSGRDARILISRQGDDVATAAAYYVDGGAVVAGRCRWCGTTNTDNAATQAAAILAALRA